jgi:glucosamine--fructose-6-phosphate aminotransferase (isomerizing)
MTTQTLMRAEIAEIPAAVTRALSDPHGAIARAGQALRAADPAFLATVARGSSDHAALYLGYAVALTSGLATASLPPSITSVFGRPMRLDRAAVWAISQSGKSPDIIETAAAARRAGAVTIALTNDLASPLAQVVGHPLNIGAGPEKSVAATKTFVTSVAAGLRLLAHWRNDAALHTALDALPDHLAQAVGHDWPEFRAALAGHRSIYVLGRGPSLAIANEAALKFKETCQIHAESYSSAEVMHGPVSIVEPGFPVLVLAARDASQPLITATADDLARKGARVFACSDAPGAFARLDFVATEHPLTDPLCLIASFYAMVERLAVGAGINPDLPRHLRKVTETR